MRARLLFVCAVAIACGSKAAPFEGWDEASTGTGGVGTFPVTTTTGPSTTTTTGPSTTTTSTSTSTGTTFVTTLDTTASTTDGPADCVDVQLGAELGINLLFASTSGAGNKFELSCNDVFDGEDIGGFVDDDAADGDGEFIFPLDMGGSNFIPEPDPERPGIPVPPELGDDLVIEWTAPRDAIYVFRARIADDFSDTVIALVPPICGRRDFECNDDCEDLSGVVSARLEGGTTVFIVVEGFAGQQASFALDILDTERPVDCFDGRGFIPD